LVVGFDVVIVMLEQSGAIESDMESSIIIKVIELFSYILRFYDNVASYGCSLGWPRITPLFLAH